MNILNINSYYLSSSVYRPMEKELIKKGINIKTYVPINKNYIVRGECKSNLDNYVTKSECINKIDRFYFQYKAKKIYTDILDRYAFDNIDIVHAHSWFSNGYIAYKLYKKYNIPYVVSVRDTDINLFYKKMIHLRSLGRDILNNASKIVFLSKGYADTVYSYFYDENEKLSIQQKSEIIPNGIDEFWIKNQNTNKIKYNKSAIKLLCVGQINKRKNLNTTIKVCKKLIDEGYEVKLTVVGKILDKKTKKKISKYKFIERIDRIDKDKLINIYRKSDIYVMPSITETFGLVYAEAMSQGLPVIYSKGQGFDQQFDNGQVGYAVNCFDINEISCRIQDILSNYNSISSNCLKNVSKFDWNKIIGDYVILYSKARKDN